MRPNSPLLDTLRTTGKLLFYLVFAVILYLAFDMLGLFIIGILLAIELGRVLLATDADGEYATNLLLGAVTVGGSLGWFWLATETSRSVLWPSIALVGGVWMLLDSRMAYLEAATDEADSPQVVRHDAGVLLSDEELMLAVQNARLIIQELRTAREPLSVAQLTDRCELHGKRVTDAIQFLRDDGTVYPVESPNTDRTRYAVDESMLGSSWAYSQLRHGSKRGIQRIVQRVARPLRYYWYRG